MNIKVDKLLLLLPLFIWGTLAGQPTSRYNSFSYNANEGLMQSTIGNLVFDNNNFCWISFPNGIQKFDGKNFITIPLQEGLPDNKLCKLYTGKDGTLYISHGLGISRYDIKKNKFTFVWKLNSNERSPALFLGEDDGVLFIYTPSGHITGFRVDDFSIISNHKSGYPDFREKPDYIPVISKEIINHKIALLIDSTICIWDLKNGTYVSKSSPISDISSFLLQLKSDHEVIFYTYKPTGTIKIYNTISKTTREISFKEFKGEHLSRCGVYYGKDKILISLNNRIFETDSSLQVLKAEIVNFQNQPFSDISGFSDIRWDKAGNLCIQTVSDGIKKVITNNYPIRFFNTNEKNKNFILTILPDKKNNRILTGALTNGILVYDTLQTLVKHIPLKAETGGPASPNCILKTPKGNYLVFAGGKKSVFELSSDLNEIRSIPIRMDIKNNKSGIEYFSTVLFQNDLFAIVQSQQNIYRIDFVPQITIREHYAANGYIMGGLYYPPFLITHGNDQLVFLDAMTFNEKKKLRFDNTGYVRCFTADAQNKIYMGTNNGLFITDTTGKIYKNLNKKTGLPDDCIYAMSFDESGNLWCSTNKGILKIRGDLTLLQLKKEDGLQENEFNTNSFAKSDDGEFFFGGVNGVSSFYPAAITNKPDNINLLFTDIRANGENAVENIGAWEMESINLPYYKNSLAFDFIAMGNHNPDQYIYQYRMEGVDKEWMQQDGEQTVRYSLPPGKYTFQVFASRAYDPKAKPLKEIRIVIQNPFWKSWWFLSLAIIAFILFLAYLINQKNKRRFAHKLHQLEKEQELKQERERISKDLHDSLGVYANAVLFNSELLEKENNEDNRKKLIADLKFASKDIIVSLRETVWALKKEKYSAEECFVRISNFIQPLTRYYTSIHFKTEGNVPSTLELSHIRALNIVRIVQEAVSNSIKHANPSNIFVSCHIIDDNKWQISIEDDGKGYDYRSMKENDRGNGLNNMEHRAIESGFALEIHSELKKGTRVTITV